jgi:hypothetical protein
MLSARKMIDAWAGSARVPEKGLEKLGWPVYDRKSMCFSSVVVMMAKEETSRAGSRRFRVRQRLDNQVRQDACVR